MIKIDRISMRGGKSETLNNYVWSFFEDSLLGFRYYYSPEY